MSILTQRRREAEVAKKVRLGDVCSIVLGGTPSTRVAEYWGGDVPWLTPGDMGKLDGVYVSETSRKLTQEGLLAGSTLFPSSSVIVSTRAPIGYVFVNSVPMCTNQGCKTLIPNGNVNARFLCLYLRSRVNELNALGTGTTFKELSTKALKNFIIPLPPLPAQRRIAAELDKICELKKNAETRLEKLDLLVKSRFVEMFGSVEKWPSARMCDLCDLITDGEHATPKRVEKGIYLLSARNVLDHELKIDDVDYIDQAEYDRIAKRVVPKEGDVLLSCSGSVGRCCVVPKGMKFQMVRSVALLRFKNMVLPKFAEYLICSPYVQRQVDKLKTASSQANLFQGKIRRLECFVPPLALQREFAAFVAKVDKLAFVARQTVKAMDTLYRAKLQEYFG